MKPPFSAQAKATVIDSPAIRMILLKAVTGRELDVYSAIAEFLNSDRMKLVMDDWWAYKIFGEYDLCFIIKRREFDGDLGNAGTIEGITYSTELLCYHWGESQRNASKNFDKNQFSDPLVFINILKLKPAYFARRGFKVEEELSSLIEKLPDMFCLGSFGWAEFVLMYPCKSFSQGYSEFIQKTLHYRVSMGGKDMGLFLKSFTIVGVNYRMLHPTVECSELKGEKIDASTGLHPSVFVSCRPSEVEVLAKNLTQSMKIKYSPQSNHSSLGGYDFVVDINGITWGDFLEGLLDFRRNKSESLFKTSVELLGPFKPNPPIERAWLFRPFCIGVTQSDAKAFAQLGNPAQESVLATIYTFNQYLQNELVADCVEDMIDYVVYTVKLLREVFPNAAYDMQGDVQQHVLQMPENIRYGCNQRLSGFLLQEGAEDFSPFKGGKQRLLKALKALCKDIFDSIEKKWYGYVVIGRQYHYNHMGDVLSIPVNAAFRVDRYWGLFHEIGHVLAFSKGSFAEVKAPEEEKDFLSSLRDVQKEIFSDLFDYQFGFLHDFRLYKKTVLDYLLGHVRNHREAREKIEEYVLRLLCVEVYDSGRGKGPANLTDRRLFALIDDLVNAFHDEIVRYGTKPTDWETLTDRIAYTYDHVKHMIEGFARLYGSHYRDVYEKRAGELLSPKFGKQFKKIMDGQIVYDLEHPQLVVLQMLGQPKVEDIPFSAHVAAIQSFLNCYYARNWERTYYPYEKATSQ